MNTIVNNMLRSDVTYYYNDTEQRGFEWIGEYIQYNIH